MDGSWTSNASELFHELNSYWSSLERWEPGQRDLASMILEDRYAVFLPNLSASYSLCALDLWNHVRHLGKSSPGLDGWSVDEIKSLPFSAWKALVEVWPTDPEGFSSTLISFVKRVPIEKKGVVSAPSPDQIRPIDVFSLLVRGVASVVTRGIRSLLTSVLLPSQHAVTGGAIVAASSLNLQAELVLAGSYRRFCISVDFVKLFNTIDEGLAAEAAQYMGLDSATSRLMVAPISAANILWRLPSSAVVPSVHNSRGIPQGLATSVALAELFISCLLQRLAWLAKVDIIAYVDLNFLADSPDELHACFSLLRTSDFRSQETSPIYGELMLGPFLSWGRPGA